MSIEAGQVLNERYRLIRPLGQGSQASVWVAEHLALSTQVAVKLIDPELAKKEEARERFRREATAAAQLRSSHVVQILDHGIENGQPFIVMELLEGEDLFERLEKRKRISLMETSKIVTQVSRALTRAHAAGIVHRDLKPENFFIVANEDDEVVKVLDFGVAKVSDPAKRTMQRTGIGMLIGTPHYMSPEQVKGIGEVDFRADLWALGVIAYQCVTGEMPFDSEGVGDLLIKISMGDMPVPSKAHKELPATFDAWFARACDRDPARRFASARDQAESLARVAGLTTEPASEVSVVAPLPQRPISRPPPSAPRPAAGSQPSIQRQPSQPHIPKAPGAPRIDEAKPKAAAPKPAAKVPAPAQKPPRETLQSVDFDDDVIEAEPAPAVKSAPKLAESVPEELSSAELVEDPSVNERPARSAPPPAPTRSAPPPAPARTTPPRAPFESEEVRFESEAPPGLESAASSPIPKPRPRHEPAAAPQSAGPQPRLALPVRPGAHQDARPSSRPARGLPSSTVSGLASITPPPEFDAGSRRKRLVRWFAFLLITLTGVVIWTVVRSQIPPKGALTEPPPPEPTAAPAVEPFPPTSPVLPSASASGQAVDPGGTRSSAQAPLPSAPAPTVRPGPRKRNPNDMTIEIPVPPSD